MTSAVSSARGQASAAANQAARSPWVEGLGRVGLAARGVVWILVGVLWPAWVWFCVMATGNHFWLDVLAGNLVALIAAAAVYHRTARRLVAKLL